MKAELTKRMIKALNALRYECDYEDGRVGGTNNFIMRGSLPPGIGEKTLGQLEDFGLISKGPYRWSGGVGY